MGAGLKPAGAALRSHTAKNPETDASGAKNGILKGLNPCQNPKNPSKCRAERLAVSNCAVVQQPAKSPRVIQIPLLDATRLLLAIIRR
jgi:hypothetical protein